MTRTKPKAQREAFHTFAHVPEEAIRRVSIYAKQIKKCPFLGEMRSLVKLHLPKTNIAVFDVTLSSTLEETIALLYGTTVWPALVIEYEVDGEARYLYVGDERATKELFEIRLGKTIQEKEISCV